ncbi:unnamed protein product [Moneuplotes crassus]|uniref:Uncharacterized protein n=1 Tax=Euplotes crassus TaxID=5936 RepID=A0AAD1UHZ6_EUPCR|nr:unnamed protein product [Moneuplotes crassus]
MPSSKSKILEKMLPSQTMLAGLCNVNYSKSNNYSDFMNSMISKVNISEMQNVSPISDRARPAKKIAPKHRVTKSDFFENSHKKGYHGIKLRKLKIKEGK